MYRNVLILYQDCPSYLKMSPGSGFLRHCIFILNDDVGVLITGAALAANPRPLRTDLSYPACIASVNFILEFPSINSRSRLFSRWRMRATPRGLWSRRQVWLPRMRQRDACWAGEVSLKGSHFATMRDGSPVSRYLYIDLWC